LLKKDKVPRTTSIWLTSKHLTSADKSLKIPQKLYVVN